MASHDSANTPLPGQRGVWLPRVFWIAACFDVLLFLGSLLNIWDYPRGEFDGLLVFALYVLLGLMAVTMGIVALIRRPMAYGIALVVIVVPLMFLGIQLFTVTA